MNCCGGNHNQPDHNSDKSEISKPSSSFKSIIWLGLIGLMLVGIWQAWPSSGLKAAAIIPFLGIMLCPLMMGLMMLLGHNHGKNHS